jgi:hypothetical protein
VAGIHPLIAALGRFGETVGAVECDCESSCWCKRPGYRGCHFDKSTEGRRAAARLGP